MRPDSAGGEPIETARGELVEPQMDHRERVLATLRGEEVDRPPISMWRHFFPQETSSEGLAEAMLGFQRRYDWDFMKVNPRASYHAEDFGLRPVLEPDDWLKLEVLDPEQGVLGEHLQALDAISLGLNGDETVTIEGLETIRPRQKMVATVSYADGRTVDVPILCRIDTVDELEYFKNGGILQYVLRDLAA